MTLWHSESWLCSENVGRAGGLPSVRGRLEQAINASWRRPKLLGSNMLARFVGPSLRNTRWAEVVRSPIELEFVRLEVESAYRSHPSSRKQPPLCHHIEFCISPELR